MKYERYENITVSPDYLQYEFTSSGPRGQINKVIQFTYLNTPGVMNLAFGNRKVNGKIDDEARDDNNDRDKILAMILIIVKSFFKEYPDRWVFFTGSSPGRTRLYRMAITLNYEELSADFQIFGVRGSWDVYREVPFKKGVDYFGFAVQLKRFNFDT